MATRFQNRRTLFLAILLALVAAATLCVWGASAAGFTFSSPALQAFFEAITGRGDKDFAQVREGGGQSEGMMPVTGEGEGDAASAGDGNGGEGAGSAALLSLFIRLD